MTSQVTYRLPVSRPSIGQHEQDKALDAIRSGWISPHGPYVDEFETRFASLCGARQALAVSSGTAALHLALATLGLEPGQEVIVPTLTYVATANVVRYMGAEPVFVDVLPESWCIDPSKAAEAVTPKTRGIIAVDLYGYPADITSLLVIAAQHDLWVVEDAAQGVGTTYEGQQVGSKAHASTFSFYGNKIVSCGQGGALTINDDEAHARAKRLRNHGRDEGGHPYETAEIGFNYALSNVACAILVAQLDRLEEMLSERHDLMRSYEARLAHLECAQLRPQPNNGDIAAPWLAAATIGSGTSTDLRDGLIQHLAAAGIETRPFFLPLHQMEHYRTSRTMGPMGISTQLAHSGLTFPTYVGLSSADIDIVCRHVVEYLSRCGVPTGP